MTQRRDGFNMDDYVPVNERILSFYEQFPEGSLQSEITHLSDGLVVVKAWAYRTADDIRPGIGHSSMEIPGHTSFTRGSEVENCETSAWGRAIASLGFHVKRGIASRDEVENKSGERDTPRPRQTRQNRNLTPTPPQPREAPLPASDGRPEAFVRVAEAGVR